MSAPDEVLIDGFKAWLATERAKRKSQEWAEKGAGKRFGNAQFQKWCQYGVLPYLDLKIHEAETGKKLRNYVVGDAIFPADADIDTTEAARKTTSLYAKEALASWHSIVAQAVAEEISKNMEKNRR